MEESGISRASPSIGNTPNTNKRFAFHPGGRCHTQVAPCNTAPDVESCATALGSTDPSNEAAAEHQDPVAAPRTRKSHCASSQLMLLVVGFLFVTLALLLICAEYWVR